MIYVHPKRIKTQRVSERERVSGNFAQTNKFFFLLAMVNEKGKLFWVTDCHFELVEL